MKKNYLLPLLFVSFGFIGKAQMATDLTDLPGGTLTTQYNDAPNGESVSMLIDNSSETKYLTFHPSAWVQFQSPKACILSRYTLTSANDSDERDPLNWELSGSNNGLTFYPIDKREKEDFSTPSCKREFMLENNKTSYVYYRLTMKNNYGGILQVSELELFGVDGTPITQVMADFKPDSYLVTEDPITFSNGSLNATTYSWSFKGGNPSKSNEKCPKVVFNKPGTYKATLVASDGKHKSKKTVVIQVKDIKDWSSFIYPKVNLDCVNRQNEGFQKYQKYCQAKGFETIEAFVQNCCLTIARNLYRTVNEANDHNVKGINYILREGGYISYEDNKFPDIEIGFDMDYLNKFSKNHSDTASADEVYGILCHELCHGYQYWPRNAGEYGQKNECFGFIEGTADLARLLTGGFNPKRYPKVGGSWLDGYNVTGFFYFWIRNTYDARFLEKLNKTTDTIDPWTLDAATKQILGKPAQELWDEYQKAIPSIVAESKKSEK